MATTQATTMARNAADYAKRTTGKVQWCRVGVFSSDGRRGFHRTGSVSAQTKEFLTSSCVRFSTDEMLGAVRLYRWQEFRCSQLAKRAIEQQKYKTAAKLCELAEQCADTAHALETHQTVLYRIVR